MLSDLGFGVRSLEALACPLQVTVPLVFTGLFWPVLNLSMGSYMEWWAAAREETH